jgi:hypothetical protein
MTTKKVKHPWEAKITAVRVVDDMDMLFKLSTALTIIVDDLTRNDECNRHRCATALAGVGGAMDEIIMRLGADAEYAVDKHMEGGKK